MNSMSLNNSVLTFLFFLLFDSNWPQNKAVIKVHLRPQNHFKCKAIYDAKLYMWKIKNIEVPKRCLNKKFDYRNLFEIMRFRFDQISRFGERVLILLFLLKTIL